MSVEKCPSCGSKRLGEGSFNDYLTPKGRWVSSRVTAKVCGDCGLIVELRVKQPEKFLPKVR